MYGMMRDMNGWITFPTVKGFITIAYDDLDTHVHII